MFASYLVEKKCNRDSYASDTQMWNVGNKVAATTPVVDIA